MTKDTAGQKEMLSQFFRVEDIFDFDNIGFTNTVETTKVEGEKLEEERHLVFFCFSFCPVPTVMLDPWGIMISTLRRAFLLLQELLMLNE